MIKKNQAKTQHHTPSELRMDLVSNDWVVIATGRARRPESFAKQQRNKTVISKKDCPFCQEERIAKAIDRRNKQDGGWLAIVAPNDFPAFSAKIDVMVNALNERKEGPNRIMDGYGYHEIVITYDHEKPMSLFTQEEIRAVVDLYHARYKDLISKPMIKYVAIFHNHGQEAGASVAHPHSQIIAIPIIDPNLRWSLDGAENFHRSQGECVYCVMLDWDLKDGHRIIYENEKFVVLCPFAPQISFEVRIYPKEHQPYFEKITEGEKDFFSDALRQALYKIHCGLNDPAFNFYLHTAPLSDSGSYEHYHWHLNIMPKTSIWAGFELGVGVEISTIEPEKAAEYLRGF